ncbi:MAG: GNAT family N-acetyltransferase [Clostridium sp.]|nr:GNAT family N-acetyltransferase [Clostridium sp.]
MELMVTQPGRPYYAEVEQLMEEAFPQEERRPREEQQRKAVSEESFRVYALEEDGCFVGLLTVWYLTGFVYVEHLATCSGLRGGGLGRKALELLVGQTELPVVLEVEPPQDELTCRRVGFYRRNGFDLWSNSDYLQPPYRKEDNPFPLLLMVHGALDEERDFEHVRQQIHTRVYGQPASLCCL